MKVGTDGILLGAWVNTAHCKQILDVGTGTGLIALMLAQRTWANITGIEMEEKAALEARQNIADSPWENRINVQHISLQKFTKSAANTFDLIISNPPFFSNALKAEHENRTLARHNDSLPLSDLVSCSFRLLNPDGRLAVILPPEQAKELEVVACEKEFTLIRETEIRPNSRKKVNRILLEFSKKEAALEKDCLTIYGENGEYTKPFKSLTKIFYLRF